MSCYKLICLILLSGSYLIADAREAYIVIPINNGDDTLSLLGGAKDLRPIKCDNSKIGKNSVKPTDPELTAKERSLGYSKCVNPAPTRTTPRTNNRDDPINLDPAIFKQYYGYDKPTGPVDTWPVDIRRRLGLD